MTNQKTNAIILVGTSSKKSKLIYEYDGQGPKNKGLVTVNTINNKPIILGILTALHNSDYINQNRIGVVGPKNELEKIINHDTRIIEEESTIFENAKKAYNEISPNGEKTFFITCDVPFITSEPINKFISKCENYDEDFYFGLVNIKNIPPETEQLKKSMKFHLKGKGYYRAGNMFMIKGKKIKDSELIASQIESAFEKRRTANFFARLELYASLAKPYWKEFLIHAGGFLTEQKVEYAIKREVGIDIKLIDIKDPRIAVDIDYQRDYDYIKKNYPKIKKILDNK